MENTYETMNSILSAQKKYFIEEVFSKGNYSTADAFFYVGQLSNHVSYFYNAITTSLNLIVQIVVYLGYLVFTNLNSLGVFFVGGIILYFPTKQLSKLLRKYVDLSYHENKKLYEDIQKLIDNIYIIKIAKKNGPPSRCPERPPKDLVFINPIETQAKRKTKSRAGRREMLPYNSEDQFF